MRKFTTKEFREFLITNEEEAIKILNEILTMDITTNEVIDYLGCSWCSISKDVEALGYRKQNGKGKGLIRIDNKGEIKVNKETKLSLTNEEILYLKELCKNKDNNINEEISIESFEDCKQKTIQLSEELSNEIDIISKAFKQFKKQDVLNDIIRRGIESYNKDPKASKLIEKAREKAKEDNEN